MRKIFKYLQREALIFGVSCILSLLWLEFVLRFFGFSSQLFRYIAMASSLVLPFACFVETTVLAGFRRKNTVSIVDNLVVVGLFLIYPLNSIYSLYVGECLNCAGTNGNLAFYVLVIGLPWAFIQKSANEIVGRRL